MTLINITTKQLSADLAPLEMAQVTGCTAIQNCSNTYVLYSFEPFGEDNIGAPLDKGLLTMPIGLSEIFLKASSQGAHVEIFGELL